GFIGSHVVRRLLSQKIEVRCLVRPHSKRSNLNDLTVELVEGDLMNVASFQSALKDCDALFHVAADYRLWAEHPEEMDRINVSGTRDLLLASQAVGVSRIVYTSSVSAIGRPAQNGHLGIGNETMDPTTQQLIGPYKKSKFASDRLVRDLAAQGLP